MSRTEAQQILERMLSPQIVTFTGTQEELQEVTDELNRIPARSMIVSDKVVADLAPVRHFDDATGEAIARLYARGLPIREIVDRMAMEGYNADTLLLGRVGKLTIGSDPAVEIAEPMVTFRAETAEDVETGDLVTVDEGGMVRRAEEEKPIGVALGDGLIRFGEAVGDATRAIRNIWGGDGAMGSGGRREHWVGSQVARYGSIAIHASMAYGYGFGNQDRRPRQAPPGQRVDGPQFKYTERFPPKVEAKAMELLRKFMSAEQYTAFIERADIELENKAGDHRLIINQNGSFKLLRGGRGAGIVMTSGNVRSYRFPLGDEIAAFLDWFRYKTPELIQNWNCGNFGIVRDRLDE